MAGNVDNFIDHLILSISDGDALFADRPVETSALVASLKLSPMQTENEPFTDFAVLDCLEAAIEPARQKQGPWSFLLEAFAELAPVLPWYQRYEPSLPAFMSGHCNAIIIGPKGLETRGTVIVGVTLMAPHIEFPDHNHPPQELYVALSGGEWRQEREPWQSPDLGCLVYNPPNIQHAMRAGAEPMLSIWCQWD